jgi:hypothetical protein
MRVCRGSISYVIEVVVVVIEVEVAVATTVLVLNLNIISQVLFQSGREKNGWTIKGEILGLRWS